MSIIEEYDFEDLQNETERLVFEELEIQLKKNKKACKCQDCVLDMAAFALNNTKPYYRVSLLGKLYANEINNSEYAKLAKKAVKNAIIKITQNPAHD